MTDYKAAMSSGWSEYCPKGWSWMLVNGGGDPVLCWHWPHPDGPASKDYVLWCPAGTAAEGEMGCNPVRTPLSNAKQSGNLWRRYVEGVKPNAGPE